MGKLIKNLCLEKYKLRMIIGLIAMSISLFFVTGNYSMIRTMSLDRDGILDSVIIRNCFSTTYLERTFLFLICVIFIGLLFKNKTNEIRESLKNGEEGRKKYFINKAICVYGLVLIPMIINIVIKLVCYYPYRDIFTLSKLGLSCFYFIVLGLFFATIVFLMNLLISDIFLAGMVPIFFLDGLIIFFAISNLLISDRLSAMREMLESVGNKVLGIFTLVDLNFNANNFSMGRQLIVISILLSITVLLIYLIYLLVKIIDKKRLDRPYFFEIPRFIIYIFMSLLVSFCFVSAVGYFSIMFMPEITYVDGTFYVNIASLIFAFIIYGFLELLYRLRIIRREGLVEKGDESSTEIEVVNDDCVVIDETSGLLDKINNEESEDDLTEEDIDKINLKELVVNESDDIDEVISLEEKEIDLSEVTIKDVLEENKINELDDIDVNKVSVIEEKLNSEDENDKLLKNILINDIIEEFENKLANEENESLDKINDNENLEGAEESDDNLEKKDEVDEIIKNFVKEELI